MGNLNGVPLKYRADANKINLTGEVASLRAQQARINQQMDAVRAQRFGRGNYAQITAELNRLKNERDRLDGPIREHAHCLHLDTPQNEYDANGRRTTRTNVEVVAFDPSAHAIATYHGRYDENGDIAADVENLGVYVPGTFTRIDHFNGADTRAYDLYVGSNAEKFGPGRTGMIAWAGGQFPNSIPDAINGKYALDLGPKLRDFVAAVDTRPDSSVLAVNGHSYGGLVVARGEAAGLGADRVMYTSSAGLGEGVQSVTEFPNTGDVPHYTMIGRGDGVVGLVQQDPVGIHGDAPPYVGSVIRAETGFQTDGDPSSGTIEETGLFKQHSSVYDVGSTAFNGHVGFFTGTQIELFSPDRIIDNPWGRYGGVTRVDGIKHPITSPTCSTCLQRRNRENSPTAPGNPMTRLKAVRRPALLASCVAVILTMTTACGTRSDVTIEEYEIQSEQIADRLMATIEGVDRYQDDIIASQSQFVEDVGHDRQDHPWQYWHWNGSVEIAPDATITPEQAADRIAAVLEDEGWTAREPDLRELGGEYAYDLSDDQKEERDWYVEIGFTLREPPAPQNVSITVVSPSTDRTAADS
ncbi:alpha/beta hydrolase [Promicromonospora sp. CA-289599]|uniref:alpha/beta hydrolase n=1 Tax=Promicromonospora sp. CA-289599 TaxID=3240014 RepID=UPI003D8AB3C8